MYTPLSSSQYSPGINADIWLLGITFVEISAISAAIEIIVTILRLRAPGMSLDRMPVFAWYMLVVAAMMLIGFPPLILGSILLEAERAFDIPFFDPQRGGSPLLWQHLFWLFGHPEVYIIFLPAAGALSTIIPVLAGTRLIGYNIIVAALIAMAFLSFGLWVHHMYTVGIPHVALSFFCRERACHHPDSDPDIRLAWNHRKRQADDECSHAPHPRVFLRVRHRRPDRRHAGHGTLRSAGT